VPKFSDESVRAALAGRKAVKPYDLPGAENVRVGIRMLTDVEMDGCRLRAQDYVLKKKCELVVDPQFFDRAIHREVVAMAFVDIDKPEEAFFGSPDEVAQNDAAVVEACWELYTNHQVAMDPYRHCSPEEVDELVELLGKAGSEEAQGQLLSSLFEPNTRSSFVISMAKRLREISATPGSSTG
jgi:hypothetical protein